MIKAIETEWKGYRFRSRLEARWAVFFEKLGWECHYEREGYRIGGTLNWLPDFEVKIGEQEMYVEVKGDPNFFADGVWISKLDFGKGPPNFTNSSNNFPRYGKENSEISKPILLLGNIPNKEHGYIFAPVLTHGKCIRANWVALGRKGIVSKHSSMLFSGFTGKECDENLSYGLKDFQPLIIATKFCDAKAIKALDAARAARFEHGEKP